MVVESHVPCPSETTEVPCPSETKALTTTEVTLQTTIEASAINDMDVTPLVQTKVTAPIETYATTPASTESSVHTYEGFPGGPNDCSVLTRYVDHVESRLWQVDVCR